jgi:hypothetical protein
VVAVVVRVLACAGEAYWSVGLRARWHWSPLEQAEPGHALQLEAG